MIVGEAVLAVAGGTRRFTYRASIVTCYTGLMILVGKGVAILSGAGTKQAVCAHNSMFVLATITDTPRSA